MKRNGLNKRFKAVELLSERLLLVPFGNKDLTLLHQTFCNPFVRKYLWDDEEISKETAREILRKNILHFENDGWGLWKALVKSKRLFIGFAGLWTFFDEDRPQLLYGLLPEFTGKGYATEAAQAVADYAFLSLGFPDLTASFDFGHLQSEKVCQRLDMTWWKEEVLEGKRTVFYRKNNSKQKMDSRPPTTLRYDLEAMSIALGVGIVGGLSYSILDIANVISYDAEISHLVILLALTYIIGMWLAKFDTNEKPHKGSLS